MSHLQRLPGEHSDYCWRCGYDRRGLANTSKCPECGADRNPDAGVAVMADERFWQLSVGTGLLLWLWASWTALQYTLTLHMNLVTLAAVNVPAPKLWVTALMKRSVGDRVETPGAICTTAAILCCVAITLLTIPRPRVAQIEPILSMRRLSRWYSLFATGIVFGATIGGWVFEFDSLNRFKSAMIVCAFDIPASFFVYRLLFELAATRAMRTREALWLASIIVPAAAIVAAGLVMYAAVQDPSHYDPQAPLVSAIVGAACAVAGAIATAGVIGLTVQWWVDLIAPLLRGRHLPRIHFARVSAELDRLAVPIGIVLWSTVGVYITLVVMLQDNRQAVFGDLPFASFIGPQAYLGWFHLSFQYADNLSMFESWALPLQILVVLLLTARAGPGDVGRGRHVLRWTIIVMMGLSGQGIRFHLNGVGVGPHSVLSAANVLLFTIPITVLLYLRIAAAVWQVGDVMLARKLRRITVAVAVLMTVSLAGLELGPKLHVSRTGWAIAAVNGVFGAVSLAIGVFATLSLLHAAVCLIRRLPTPSYNVSNDSPDPHSRAERTA